MIRVFGFGNVFLGDDGIGVKVTEVLKNKIENLEDNIEVTIGKIDSLKCIAEIEDDDRVIIIDSTYFMTRPGAITIKKLNECDEFISYDNSSQEEKLLSLLRKKKREINGYLIGIEVSHIDHSEQLSKNLAKKFNAICNRVYDEIIKIVAYS